MKINRDTTLEQISARLENLAQDVYGDTRTVELKDQLDHLANMMHLLSLNDLEIRDARPLMPAPDREGRR